MSDPSKTFTYSVDGLSYTVTVYEEGGKTFADITVDEGAMDVNAVYFGDADHSGDSADLGKSLGMKGGGARTDDGGAVQWDDAVALSEPGLGPEGDDKETYLAEGDTLTLELGVDSLDEIAVFGIRATSTTTDAGSIKAVMDQPEDPEDPENPEDPEDPLYQKVFFESFDDANDNPESGCYIQTEPDEYGTPVLPADQEPTFENYLAYFQQIGGDVTSIEGIAFYEEDEDGVQQETFRIEAPEDGFADIDEVLAAHDAAPEALDAEDLEPSPGDALIAALSLPEESDDQATDEADETEDDLSDVA